MNEPDMTTCRGCDRRVLVRLTWRCSAHTGQDAWVCLTCALKHEQAWLSAGEACLWWVPFRSQGRWWGQASMVGPHTDPDAYWAAGDLLRERDVCGAEDLRD